MITDDKGRGGTSPARDDEALEAEEAKFVFRLFDSLAQEDRDAYEQILSANSKLGGKYKHLDRTYTHIREALASGPDLVREKYPAVMAEVDSYFEEGTLAQDCDLALAAKAEDANRRIGALTALTRNWPRPEVVEFYMASTGLIVSIIVPEIGLEMKAHEILADAEYLCSLDMIARLQKSALMGKHVRDVLIEVLAERWKKPDLVQRLSREKLEELLVKNRVLRLHLAVWEDKMTRVA